MNRIYNIWIFIISIFGLFYSLLLEFHRLGSFDTVLIQKSAHYKDQIFAIAAVLIFLLGALRSYRKWSGTSVVNQIDRFQFNTPISQYRRKLVISINLMEILSFTLIAIAFMVFYSKAFYLPLIFFIFVADFIVNSLVGAKGKKYRIGMTKKAIISSDREVVTIYFQGLKHVSIQRDLIFFEYINDLVLTLPLSSIPLDKQSEFLKRLKDSVDEKKVFFSGF